VRLAIAAAIASVLLGCGARDDAPTASPVSVATVPSKQASVAALTTRRPTAQPIAQPIARKPARPSTAMLSRAIGQRLITGFTGTQPPPAALSAIRDGSIGGVILFADNFQGAEGARQLIAALQTVAHRSGRPPLLVMVDQEGGIVKRLPALPPTRSPAAIGAAADITDESRAEGLATGRALRGLGFNVDLAPVADVPLDSSSFLGTRAFGDTPSIVARGACGFADGLRRGGVASTLKHFPGLGRARVSTDRRSTSVPATRAQLRGDLAAYRRCGAQVPLVMLSSAVYPALDAHNPAVLSPSTRALLSDVGFTGLTISDALDTPAMTPRRDVPARALRVGVDLLLYGQGTDRARQSHDQLLAQARAGRLDAADLIATATRIIAFKRRLAAGDP
jgi:beta-N-acetylhexosaminidase